MRPAREKVRSSGQTYFVSSQTKDRRPFFRHERWALLLQEVLEHYRGTAYFLHAYVLMPDHFHALLSPQTSLEQAMQNIKGGFSFKAKKAFAWRFEIWQVGFSDHRIRDLEDWNRHMTYMRRNPIEEKLADPYPYQALAMDPMPGWLDTNMPKQVQSDLRKTETINATQE